MYVVLSPFTFHAFRGHLNTAQTTEFFFSYLHVS